MVNQVRHPLRVLSAVMDHNRNRFDNFEVFKSRVAPSICGAAPGARRLRLLLSSRSLNVRHHRPRNVRHQRPRRNDDRGHWQNHCRDVPQLLREMRLVSSLFSLPPPLPGSSSIPCTLRIFFPGPWAQICFCSPLKTVPVSSCD